MLSSVLTVPTDSTCIGQIKSRKSRYEFVFTTRWQFNASPIKYVMEVLFETEAIQELQTIHLSITFRAIFQSILYNSIHR